MYYLIKETLTQCNIEDIKYSDVQYVAVVTLKQWQDNRESFDMGIDIEPDIANIFSTKVYVNFDSLTGTFCIPDRNNFNDEKKFAFALDEKGIVFIDDSKTAEKLITKIKQTKKWRFPSLERFIYDFLDQIIKNDSMLLENYARELDLMENEIVNEKEEVETDRVNDIRGDIRDIGIHYEQLLDLGQLFEENENNFFKNENLRYFRLFSSRIERLRDTAASLRDYTIQIRDLQKEHLEVRQNRIMTVLTVVTTIFLPLTLIVGWYGMNFKYMPELDYKWAYPTVFIISILIVIGSIILFKKKKWL